MTAFPAHHLKILPQYATINAAARKCKVSISTLKDWVTLGKVPSLEWSETRLVLLADVRRVMAKPPKRGPK